jgi:hypothetical protein
MDILHHVRRTVEQFVREKKPQRLTMFGDSNKKHSMYHSFGLALAKKFKGQFIPSDITHHVYFPKPIDESQEIKDVGLWVPWLKKYGKLLKGNVLEGPARISPKKLRPAIAPMSEAKYVPPVSIEQKIERRRGQAERHYKIASNKRWQAANRKLNAEKRAMTVAGAQLTMATALAPVTKGLSLPLLGGPLLSKTYHRFLAKQIGYTDAESDEKKYTKRERAYRRIASRYQNAQNLIGTLPQKKRKNLSLGRHGVVMKGKTPITHYSDLMSLKDLKARVAEHEAKTGVKFPSYFNNSKWRLQTFLKQSDPVKRVDY